MTETKLDKARAVIDECDAMIAEAFEKRFHAVQDVIDYKIENRMPILDSSREDAIKERNYARIIDDDIRPYFKTFFEDMLVLSKEYQKEMQARK